MTRRKLTLLPLAAGLSAIMATSLFTAVGAQAQSTVPSLDPTKARSPLNPPTVVSGPQRGSGFNSRGFGGYRGGGYYGSGYWGGVPYGGWGNWGGWYPPVTVIGGNYWGPWGGFYTSPFPTYSLTPQVPQYQRALPPYFSTPLRNEAQRSSVRPQTGEDFYLAQPENSAPRVEKERGIEALGGRLSVTPAEGDLYLVDWRSAGSKAGDIQSLTFRTLDSDGKLVGDKTFAKPPFRGLLSVPKETTSVELEIRDKEGVSSSLKLPVARFKAISR